MNDPEPDQIEVEGRIEEPSAVAPWAGELSG